MGLVVVGSEWIGLFRMTMLTVMNNYVVLRPKSILNYKRSFRKTISLLFHKPLCAYSMSCHGASQYRLRILALLLHTLPEFFTINDNQLK